MYRCIYLFVYTYIFIYTCLGIHICRDKEKPSKCNHCYSPVEEHLLGFPLSRQIYVYGTYVSAVIL